MEDEEYIDLGDLDEIVDDGEKEIYNEEMIERGDDYCVIELDENGNMLAYFPSSVKPDSEEILNYLK